MSSRKRIGFVDDELDNFHANTYLAMIRTDLAARGFQVVGCTARQVESGQAWAQQNQVRWFDSIEAMDRHVDGYVILAPSSPQTHWPLCQAVLPMGKPTYVDKTFASDLESAKRIFALADAHHAPVQSSSALRYSNVQQQVAGLGAVDHMVAWGGGRSFGEYAIHPVELVISCMGPGARRLMRRGQGEYSQLLIDFADGRTAVVNVYLGETPFAASVTADGRTQLLTVDAPIFKNMTAAILDLLESGEPTVDRAQTLIIRRILDAADDPAAQKQFVDL